MAHTVDYYHFLISPWSYLAIGRFNEIKSKTGANVNYYPIDVMSTFGNMGGQPPAKRHPSRQKFRMDELKRWSSHLAIPMNLTPAFFPVDQSTAARMVYAAAAEDAGTLSDAVLTAVWRDEKNIADTDTLVAIADDAGLDGKALLAASSEASCQEAFDTRTAEAHERNVFGSPSWIVNDELFWGQDRLDFLSAALA